MEMFAMVAADTITLPTTSIGAFPNRHSSTTTLSISSSLSPVDSMAPPVTRPNIKTIPRTCPRRKRRTKRRSQTDDGGDENGNGFYGDGGGDDGPFGGSGGGGGRGWNNSNNNNNSNDNDGFNWEESSSSSYSDPAFDFVYKVLCWIVLSNCVHFSLKKIFRIVANGLVGDPSREKVPMRLASLY